MKEIHAYKNEDGTYRIEGVSAMTDHGELKDVIIQIPRADLNINVLKSDNSKELFTLTVKENNNETRRIH